jgi:hypothetical protein
MCLRAMLYTYENGNSVNEAEKKRITFEQYIHQSEYAFSDELDKGIYNHFEFDPNIKKTVI